MAEPIRAAERLTTAEAAARLGVKKQTLYAYVSRGVITPEKLDGRTSTFDAGDVEGLRRRNTTRRAGGLDVQIPTRITRIADDQLWYRGYSVTDLVAEGVEYEQVAELLWTEALPDQAAWTVDKDLLEVVQRAQALLPPASPVIDRLRLAATLVSVYDPLRHDLRPVAVAEAGRQLIATMVESLPLQGAARRGTIAQRLWPRLTRRRGSTELRQCLRSALVLLADHELATATVGARVAASARADPYSVALAGMGVVAGALHGAASLEVHDLLTAVDQHGDPAEVVGDVLRQGRNIPGFGHMLYGVDPRAVLLLEELRHAAAGHRLELVLQTAGVVRERAGVEPNIDFALAGLAFCSGMGREAGEAVFAIGRCAGWLAHALEEWGETPLRFRPTARYLGPVPR